MIVKENCVEPVLKIYFQLTKKKIIVLLIFFINYSLQSKAAHMKDEISLSYKI